MSDARVDAAVTQMEVWLADPAWEPEAGALTAWQAELDAAAALAPRGAGWPALAERAHAAAAQLTARAQALAEARDRVKVDLEALGRGNRALLGYGIGTH